MHLVASRETPMLQAQRDTDPPVVLTHGDPLDEKTSNLDVEVLAGHGRLVVGVDRTQGATSFVRTRDGAGRHNADGLLHILEALDLRDIVIVGLARESGELIGYRSRPGDGIFSRIQIDGRDQNAPCTVHGEAVAPLVAYVEQHLRDAELSAETIARSHHMSVRLLYKIWAANTDSTLAEYIISRRLAAIRRDLTDPGLSHVSISTIASGWGFINAAHFSRRFRAAYGITAKECRRNAPQRRR